MVCHPRPGDRTGLVGRRRNEGRAEYNAFIRTQEESKLGEDK